MNLSDYNTDRIFTADVVSSDRITDQKTAEVRHIVLRIVDPAFQFVEGQSIAVIVPGPHAFGNDAHVRLYSIASSRDGEAGNFAQFSLCVRRCSYIDDISGERYPGIASNYLCDRQPGDQIQVSGPYGRQFHPPRDNTKNILMIGVGTGIAPFRAFMKFLYRDQQKWQGKVRLFYGGQTGMDMLYMNDKNGDIANYYDEETFQAFEALSPRPHFDEPAQIEQTIQDNATEVAALLQDPDTYVYISGLSKLEDKLDTTLAQLTGSADAWATRKHQLVTEGRWATLFYE